jgi:hypothetical protein
MRNAATTALLVLVTAGCAGSDTATETSTTDGTPPPAAAQSGGGWSPYPGAGVDCPADAPAPISVGEASEALREHGFSVEEVEGSCGLETISALLSNATYPPPYDVHEREGSLNCYVLVTPRAPGGEVDGAETAASAARRLANLDCTLWGADRHGFDGDLRRLEGAFEELRRGLPPQ